MIIYRAAQNIRHSVLKVTTENKTTSVTTHFKSAISSSKADILNI